MLNYNLKIAWRNLLKNKSSAFTKITSLVVGFSCLILIGLWMQYQLSYDKFHEKVDRTYRISYHGVLFGQEMNETQTSKAIYEALSTHFPEVKTATIISNFHEALLCKKNGEAFMVKLSGINPSFFETFTVPIISGDVRDLAKPNTAFISQEMARKFFGNKNPIGEVISTGMDRGTKEFTIVGLVKSLPENSHFDFDMLYSNTSQSWYSLDNTSWVEAGFYNYIVLKEGVDPRAFEKKFNQYSRKQIAGLMKAWKNMSLSEWEQTGDNISYKLQAMPDIHLHSNLNGEYKQNGNILYVYIFLIAGILILIISIINFSNLSTVGYFGRSKEIGIRKVAGSRRNVLIAQYLFESCLLSFIALFISLILIFILSPFFENLAGIKVWSSHNLNIYFFVGILLIALFSGVLGGAFPAFVLSKLSPVKIFSSSGKTKFRGVFLKDVMIVGQFVISIVVIIGTLLITQQLDYLQNKNLGFKKDNILVIKRTVDLPPATSLLLNQKIQQLPYVKHSASSHYLPNGDISYGAIAYQQNNKVETGIIRFLPCDQNYQRVYQFNLLKGQYFDKHFNENSRKIILNEKAVKSLNMEDCLGEKIYRNKTEYEIIGVVKDFHFNSKQQEIEALGLVQLPDAREFWPPNYCSVLLNETNVQHAVKGIEEIWNEIAPGIKFSYAFFDEEYDRLYHHEAQTKKVFIIFSFIAIALSCLGLFGFVKYTIQIRTKEIGIRKVNGAKNESIFRMLSRYFTRPVIVALLIACPIAWFAVDSWLQNFAYKIEINLVYFVLAGVLTVAIVFLTVGWTSWRAARRNPVEALRYE